MGKSRLIPTIFVLTVLAALGWAAVYAYDKGFTKRWRMLIMDELARRGIEAEIGKLTFDPFEGLVARKVTIFEGERHEKVLATINNLTLDIDLARLVRKEQFLNTIDLRDADIFFPIDPDKPEAERIQISNFSARIQMPAETIDILKAEFEVAGLQVNLTGSLGQPTPAGVDGSEDPPTDTRVQRRFISNLVAEIEKFESSGEKPQLDIEVFGDLDDPAAIEAKMQLRATGITRSTYSCNELEADLEFAYPLITLDRLLIVDGYGELHGHAEYSIGGDSVVFDVESSIDSHSLLRSVLEAEEIDEVLFREPPRLHVEGEYFIDEEPEPQRPPLRAFGNLNCGKFTTRKEEFEGFHVDFSIDRERIFLRNLLLEHKTGTAEAKILFNREEGMRYSASVDLSPKIFSLFIDNQSAKNMIARFDFDKSPNFSLKMDGRGPARDRSTWQTTGQVSASSFRYNGIPVDNVHTKFSLEEGVLSFRNFSLDRPEGRLSGELAAIDNSRDIAFIRGVKGSIDPVATTAYLDPGLAEELKQYQFDQPPQVTLDGTIDLSDSVDNDFTVTFKTDGAARYTFLKKSLPLSKPDGQVRIRGTRLDLDLETQLFGGAIDMTGQFSTQAGRRAFTSEVSVRDIEFAELAKTYELETDTVGTFTGDAQLSGLVGSLESIDATGTATIRDGNVFSIPVLGPLSKLINLMMPRNPQAGYSIAKEASAKMRLKGGLLHTDDFQAVAGGFKLQGDGVVDVIEDEIDFSIQMNLRGAPGVVLYPVSRLFKYKGEGPASDPRWRPVNFSLPRGDGPGLLGGPGILPRNRNGAETEEGEMKEGGRGKRPRILENGIPVVRPLRKGITKGIVKGGEVITKGGKKVIRTGGDAIKTGGEAIKNTGERILGSGEKEKAKPDPVKPKKAVKKPARDGG